MHAINIWKAVHAGSNPNADGIDPTHWGIIPREDMVDGPSGTKFLSNHALQRYHDKQNRGMYLTIKDVKYRRLSEVLALVDKMEDEYQKMLNEQWEGFSGEEDDCWWLHTKDLETEDDEEDFTDGEEDSDTEDD